MTTDRKVSARGAGHRVRALVLALLSVLLSAPVHASLVDLGSRTLDRDTGLEWLDLTLTQGQSLAAVRAGFGGFTSTQGWRVADQDELSTLYTSAGFRFATGGNRPEQSEIDAALLLTSLLGVTSVRAVGPFTVTEAIGWYDPVPAVAGAGRRGAVNFQSNSAGTPFTGSAGFGSFFVDTRVEAGVGTFLVRSASTVPAPPALALLIVAALGLRRRCDG